MFESLQPPPPPATRTRWGRWLRGLVRVAFLAALTPVVAYGLLLAFLQYYLPMLLNRQPERLQVTWDVVWPSWPGDVEVRNLTVRSQGPVDQWILRVDRVDARINVEALRHQTLAASAVRASGVSFLYRVRRAPGEPLSTKSPPIPGLTNPPDPAPEAIYPPPAAPWRIHLTDVEVAGVREVWVEDYHYVGRASARGELDLTPGKWVQVNRAQLDLEEGQLLDGDVTVAAGVHGDLDLRIDGVDPLTQVGGSLFDVMTVRTRGQAQVRSLAFLDSFLAQAPWLRFTAGDGTLDVDLAVQHTRIRPGSRVLATLDDIDVRLFSYRVNGDGRVLVEMGDESGAVMVADFSDYAIRHEGDRAAHVEGKGFRVTARAAHAGLDGVNTDDLRIVVELPESRIPDARVYNAYLPQDMGLALEKGSGTVHGKLTVTTADNKGVGELVIRGTKVQLKLDDLTMSGDVVLNAKVPMSRIDIGRYDVSGTRLELRNVRITDPNHATSERGARGWWAVLSAPQGTVRVGAKEYLDARARLTMRDTDPFITVFASKSTLPRWIFNLASVEDIRGHARIRLGEDSLAIPQFEIEGGQFDVELQLLRKRDDVRGKMFARWGMFGVGVYRQDGKNKIQLINARRWYDAQPGVE